MTSQAEEQVQTPTELLLALKAEMRSLKAEEKSVKAQLISLNEQFQLLVKSAAEVYPEILDEDFSNKVTARKQRPKSSYRPLREADDDAFTPGSTTRLPSFSRGSSRSRESPHRKLTFDSQRYPRRYARHNSDEAVAKIQEQFQNNVNAASGIDARKIRSSLPNSPTEETLPDKSPETSDEERRRKLKKKMIESRKVDVVNLGLF